MILAIRQIPNAITVFRILLVGPIIFCLAREWYRDALWLFLLAGLSDGLDGFLARTFHWHSRFGAITDPLADKLLLVSVFIALTVTEAIPLWLTLIVFGRDLVIVAGALTYHMLIGSYSMRPSLWGKLCTFVQITYLLSVIIYYADLPMPQWAVAEGKWLVAAVSLFSGGHYVLVWGSRFLRERTRASQR